MVISQGMMEIEMGYRGSKSNISNIVFVKEQRVDGSCIGTPIPAKCGNRKK